MDHVSFAEKWQKRSYDNFLQLTKCCYALEEYVKVMENFPTTNFYFPLQFRVLNGENSCSINCLTGRFLTHSTNESRTATIVVLMFVFFEEEQD